MSDPTARAERFMRRMPPGRQKFYVVGGVVDQYVRDRLAAEFAEVDQEGYNRGLAESFGKEGRMKPMELAGWVFGLPCFSHVVMDVECAKQIAVEVEKIEREAAERIKAMCCDACKKKLADV